MTHKTKIVDGKTVSFDSDWIYDLEQEIHFNWYYQQTKIVYEKCQKNLKLLEIGIGTGLLSDLLRKRKWNIKTLDIDEEKQPDFCCSAVEFDYKENAIQAVLAFEIFEHIPFETFEKLIEKLCKDNIESIYFSIPWNERTILNISIKLPKLPTLEWQLAIPIGTIKTKNHFWELSRKEKILDDKKLVSLKKLGQVFSRNNYKMIKLMKIGRIQYFSAQLSAK